MATAWGKRECVSTRESVLFQNTVTQHSVDVIFKARKEADVPSLYYHAV